MMNDSDVTFQQLKDQIQVFCEERDWDQFHEAKDLAIGVITEASELLEHFRFQTKEQVEEKMNDATIRAEVGDELADVLFFLLRFSQRYQFNLADCVSKKMKRNGERYPISEFKGKNNKAK